MEKKQESFTNLVPETVRNTAMMLAAGFDWEQSKEGHAYWYKIYNRLNEIAGK